MLGRVTAIVIGIGCLACVSCGGGQQAVYTPSSYRSAMPGFGVEKGADGRVLPAHWRIDNFWDQRGEFVPKDTEDYWTSYDFDLNGDGITDSTERDMLYELRFESVQDGGVIWLRSFPISGFDRDKSLAVLMKGYIDGAAVAGYEAVVIGTRPAVLERRYAARTVNEGRAIVARTPAYEAVIDVSNIDRIKVEPGAIEKRVKLVLFKPGFSREVSVQGQSGEFPVLVLAGYVNNPGDFDGGGKEFDDFLDRIVVSGKSGYTRSLPSSEE